MKTSKNPEFKKISVELEGPFGWPKLEEKMEPLPKKPGVYIMTVKYKDGFLPYGVGITRRPMGHRFMEHSRNFLSGEYNILELNSALEGIRKLLWKGWGWTPEKRTEFEQRKSEIVSNAKEFMRATHIFILAMDTSGRLLERMEAAIVNHYYKSDDILFDRGTLRMPRKSSEEPILVGLISKKKIYGLPNEIEI